MDGTFLGRCRIFCWEILYRCHSGGYWKQTLHECKNVLLCWGEGLSFGNVIFAWCRLWFRRNGRVHWDVRIWKNDYCYERRVCVRYISLWNFYLFVQHKFSCNRINSKVIVIIKIYLQDSETSSLSTTITIPSSISITRKYYLLNIRKQ